MRNNNHNWSRISLSHLLVVIERVTKVIDNWERNWLGDWVWGIMITAIDIIVTMNITTAIILIMLLTNTHL